MKSSRPYLIRALYEWIVDNECTPHLLVDTEQQGVEVPAGYARDGQIVLNVSPMATRGLSMDNEWITFESRFGGVPHQLRVPTPAVMAIYARENGQGMVFETEVPEAGVAPEAGAGVAPLSAVPSDAGDGPDDEPPRPSGRPSLKVVK